MKKGQKMVILKNRLIQTVDGEIIRNIRMEGEGRGVLGMAITARAADQKQELLLVKWITGRGWLSEDLLAREEKTMSVAGNQ